MVAQPPGVLSTPAGTPEPDLIDFLSIWGDCLGGVPLGELLGGWDRTWDEGGGG